MASLCLAAGGASTDMLPLLCALFSLMRRDESCAAHGGVQGPRRRVGPIRTTAITAQGKKHKHAFFFVSSLAAASSDTGIEAYPRSVCDCLDLCG